MINIVIPMAGNGSRFAQAGYKDPKPFIMINGKRMIERVIDNLRPDCEHQFIFIARKEHLDNYDGRAILEAAAPGCKIVEVDQVTEGAACTVLLAKDHINNQDPLIIANSDQLVTMDFKRYAEGYYNHDTTKASIVTMRRDEPKWSFVGKDPSGDITRVIEKCPISKEATVGIYYFKHGTYFVDGANAMIRAGIRHNGEFYVAPVYNELIQAGLRIHTHEIPAWDFHGLGTPEDLEIYLAKV